MSGRDVNPLEAHRQIWKDYVDELRKRADDDCRLCRGSGTTRGYVSPGVYAVYACPCTGRADWQREIST